MTGMCSFATHIDKCCVRGPRREPHITGQQWVEKVVADRNICYKMFRMNPTMFHCLHDLLVESYGLNSRTKSSSEEAL